MNELQVFESAQFGQVRTVQKDGEPWFVAADVCRALEITNSGNAISRLDEDEKMTIRSTDSHSGERGGAQMMSIVNEPGLYSLVLGSRKPEAKSFKRWITHEVIPSIRRHGAYATDSTIDRIIDDPDFGIRLLGQLKQEREARRALDHARGDSIHPQAWLLRTETKPRQKCDRNRRLALCRSGTKVRQKTRLCRCLSVPKPCQK